MKFMQNIKKALENKHRDISIYSFVRPNYIEERDEKMLLVWGGNPFWIVVDREFYEMLTSLDGKSQLNSIIDMKNYSRGNRAEILKGINLLVDNGAVIDHRLIGIKQKQENTEFVPIENVAVNLTRSCNLCCKTCYNYEENPKKKSIEISDRDIIKALKEIKPFLSKKATLTVLGGEPLLFETKLLKICEEAVNIGMKVIISTNGMNISDNFCNKASKLKVEVQVSLDGHSAELNDSIRGSGTFDRAITNIKKLVHSRVYTIISLVCHKDNVDYLEEFYRLALSLRVQEARFIPLKLMGAGKSGALTPVSITKLIVKGHQVYKDNKELRKLFGRDCYSILSATCYYLSNNTSCGTGSKTLLVDSDGSIYPCANTAIEEFKLANINDHSFDFEQLWYHSEFLESFRERTSIDSMNAVCSKCAVKRWCLGSCRGETLAVKNDLSAPAYNCEDMRQAIIETFWILAEREEDSTKFGYKC